MLFIIFNWLTILYICYMHGFFFRSMFCPQLQKGFSVIFIWGCAWLSLLMTILLFFKNISGFELLFCFFTALIIHIRFRAAISHSIKLLLVRIKPISVALPLGFLVLGTLIFSVQPSLIYDDGFYYTPTVRWLNEIGFVKGISNLNLGLGLTSSWHILQALFSMSFIEGINFNDLNGTLLVVLFIFWIEIKNEIENKNLVAILIGLAILSAIPFLTACSPDFPVIAFTVIALITYINLKDAEQLKDVFLISLLCFSIKLSSVYLIMLGMLVFAHLIYRSRSIKGFLPFSLFSFVFILLVLVKNFYLTGYPFYPFNFLSYVHPEWATPENVLSHYYNGIRTWSFADKLGVQDITELSKTSFLESIKLLLTRNGIKGIINCFIFGLFVVSTCISLMRGYHAFKNKNINYTYVTIHIISLFTFFTWLQFAPQYRFIMPLLIFYSAYVILFFKDRFFKEKISSFLLLSPVWVIIPFFILSLSPLSMKPAKSRRNEEKRSILDMKYIIKPHVSFNFGKPDSLFIQDQKFFYFKKNNYCWDCSLPCLPVPYHAFLLENHHLQVERIGNDLKSGFKLTKANPSTIR
jgi:hypothetical protein